MEGDAQRVKADRVQRDGQQVVGVQIRIELVRHVLFHIGIQKFLQGVRVRKHRVERRLFPGLRIEQRRAHELRVPSEAQIARNREAKRLNEPAVGQRERIRAFRSFGFDALRRQFGISRVEPVRCEGRFLRKGHANRQTKQQRDQQRFTHTLTSVSFLYCIPPRGQNQFSAIVFTTTVSVSVR